MFSENWKKERKKKKWFSSEDSIVLYISRADMSNSIETAIAFFGTNAIAIAKVIL